MRGSQPTAHPFPTLHPKQPIGGAMSNLSSSFSRSVALYRAEARAYLLNAIRPLSPKQARLVIFAQGRTGTTLLESLLVSTGHFKAGGEMLNCNDHRIRYPFSYTVGRAKDEAPQNFFFHVKIYHLTRDRGQRPVDPAKFLGNLHQNGWKILYLRRDNILQHALSNLVAEARGNYHRYENSEEKLRFSIDPSELRRMLRERREFQVQEVAALEGLPRMSFQYETNLEDATEQQRTVDTILDTLGLERRPAQAKTLKVNRFAPSELIENFREIDEIVRAEGLEW
jgi:LPS sulfotransferase NodH